MQCQATPRLFKKNHEKKNVKIFIFKDLKIIAILK